MEGGRNANATEVKKNYKDMALISAIISCDSQSPCNSSGEKENMLGESRLGSGPDAVRRSDDAYT